MNTRSTFLTALVCFASLSCSSAENKPASSSQAKTNPLRYEMIPLGGSQKVKVLMIGDSLTVGPFGSSMQNWLIQRYGDNNVAIYASCGSSPEHWLAENAVFTSKCGYREKRPGKLIYENRDGGSPTRVRPAPKIEKLIALHRPDTVIVQMGTNHFDVLEKNGDKALPQLAANYEKFSQALKPSLFKKPGVYWITPPDSSRFSEKIKRSVDQLILTNNRKHGFHTFHSRRYTRYIKGVSGSDGVHYGRAAATAWALEFQRQTTR